MASNVVIDLSFLVANEVQAYPYRNSASILNVELQARHYPLSLNFQRHFHQDTEPLRYPWQQKAIDKAANNVTYLFRIKPSLRPTQTDRSLQLHP